MLQRSCVSVSSRQKSEMMLRSHHVRITDMQTFHNSLDNIAVDSQLLIPIPLFDSIIADAAYPSRRRVAKSFQPLGAALLSSFSSNHTRR